MATLAELRNQIRDRADQPGSTNSGFIKNSEFNTWINSSITELHDLLVTTYGADYYLDSNDINLVNGTATYALPADFYKLKGVDLRNGSQSQAYSLRPFNFNERNNYSLYSNTIYENYKYNILGNNIKLIPKESVATGDILTLWYHPKAVTLVNDTDNFDGINGYEEYVILDCCIKAQIKQEQDPIAFYQQKNDMKQRIIDSADNRSSGNLAMTDIYAENLLNPDFV